MTEIEALIIGDSIAEGDVSGGRFYYEMKIVSFEYVIRTFYQEGYEIVKKKIRDN